MFQPLQYSEPLIISRFFGMHFSIFQALQRVLSGQGTAARLKETRSLGCAERFNLQNEARRMVGGRRVGLKTFDATQP